MDPLSIAAATIALLGACKKLQDGVGVVRQLSHVPEEMATLLNELQDLWDVLAVVRVVAERRGSIGGLSNFSHELRTLLLKTKDLLDSIGSLSGFLTCEKNEKASIAESGFQTSVVARDLNLRTRCRWLRDRKTIFRCCQQLHTIRLDIVSHLAILNLDDSSSIYAALDNLGNTVQSLNDEQSKLHASLVHMKFSTATQDVECELESKPSESEAGKVELRIKKSALSPVRPSMSCNTVSTMSCRCSCHQISRFTTPKGMQSVLGRLDVKVQGCPYMNPACTETTCRKTGHLSLGLSYRFPPWLFNRAVHSIISGNSLHGPQLSLACTRTISSQSDIFWLAQEGNIAGIQQLFHDGKASPFDVSHVTGLTPLHFAVAYGHVELCDFLLKSGARREIQTYGGLTATDFVYNRVYYHNLQDWVKDISARMWEYFDRDLWLEQQQFTVLHRLVMGFETGRTTLDCQLSLTTRDINALDSAGRTPLSWAAQWGNLEAISTLIDFGADVNLSDNEDNSPLHYGCRSGKYEIFNLLLARGASPARRNALDQTPLMRAAAYQSDPTCIDQLLAQPGVALNETDVDAWNAVWFAANGAQAANLVHLLDLVADVNQRDNYGCNILIFCIRWNKRVALEILLAKARPCGLDLAHRDPEHDGCLHYLASYANAETARVFLHAIENAALDLGALDTALTNKEGSRPRELLIQREDGEVTATLEKAFALIDYVTGTQTLSDKSPAEIV